VAPPTRFDDLSLDELRQRRSEKWRRYPADVLPAWVAELDFPLAPPVGRALAEAVERNDTGYANARGLPETFASFAGARWGGRSTRSARSSSPTSCRASPSCCER